MTDGDKTASNPQAVVEVAADQVAVQKASTADVATRKTGANVSITDTLDATVDEHSAAPDFEGPKEKPFDSGRHRDTTRSWIAYWLLSLLTLVVVFSFGSVIVFSDGKVTFDNLKSLLELIMGPIVALVSAATGFYFGSQQSSDTKKH